VQEIRGLDEDERAVFALQGQIAEEGEAVRVLVVGGAGFVGLNIAARLAELGHEVSVLDRALPPASVLAALGGSRAGITFISGDVTRPESVAAAVIPGLEAIVYGAAITADAARDAAEPERILSVNLVGLVHVLRAARAAGVRRVINLSSGSALGRAVEGPDLLHETLLADPVSLYAITKHASERVADRLADLWQMDIINVRLSSVFGPLEYATGVRDTLSPLGQIMMAATRGTPAVLARPGVRDWVYAPDVADAIFRLLEAPKLVHRLYNITSGQSWSALAWGERLAGLRPGFSCRLATHGEATTIDLFAATDRPPLSAARLKDELGWIAAHGLQESLADFDAWSRRWGAAIWGQP
jgi:UDP-glucose 4-epimerase